MLIESISVSRKGVWNECHQRYKYRYHLKIPSPEPEPEYFGYGKIIHKIIETHTLARGHGDIGKITQAVLSGEIEIEPGRKAPQLSLEYKRKIPDHLRSYLKLAEKIGTEGQVEWAFRYDLDPPHGKVLNGFIDRLITKGDEYTIIDWKTSKKNGFRKTSETVTEDLQLQAYCRIVQKTFNADPAKIKAALYYLEGGELVGARFSAQTLDSVEEKLLKAYNEVKAADPDKVVGRTGWHCKRCDYRTICPWWQAKEANQSKKPWE